VPAPDGWPYLNYPQSPTGVATYQSPLSMAGGFDKITIYTVDGTGSTDPTHSDAGMTGGFPARVAQQLDPDDWRWVPVAYPAAAFPMGDSVQAGVDKIINMIAVTPGPFVLSGLSQGAMVCSKVYDEVRFGRLRHRKFDLVAGVMFGNPARQPGHHIDLLGAVTPAGGGIQDFDLDYSFGERSGILSGCDPFWWEFANPGDPVCTAVAGNATEQMARVFSFVYYSFNGGLPGLVSALGGLVADPAASVEALDRLFDLDGSSAGASPHIEYHLPYTPLAGNTTQSAVDLAVDYLEGVFTATRAAPPPPPGRPAFEALDRIEGEVEGWREQLGYLRRAKPMITFYRNKQNGDPGLEYYGRVAYQDTLSASFPLKKNVSAQGVMELRFDHYISEWMRSIPNDPKERKNVVIRVDMFGGRLRWTGLLHHHAVKTRDGMRYMEFTFNDDLQFLQFLLGPPNPVLPIPVFQFPRVFALLGPAKWACSIMILLNLIRVEGNLWTLPDDPFDLDQWDDLFPWSWGDWQAHIKCNPLPLDDSSLWTVIGSRMNPVDSVLADALEDAQLTLKWRRCFTDEGEQESGLLFNTTPANGALVFEIVDDSGYYSPLKGTFLGGSIIDGMVRSVVQYVGGFVEDTGALLTDNESIYPDAYYGPGFLGTLAEAPWLVIRDSSWTPIETSELTWSPATAVRVIVGGDNPAADAIARLIIQTTGNILGYFLLFGFSSAGDIAAELIMPFLVGTIAAWLEWKNFSRAQNLGWVHLWELYQQGGENNSWSLSAIAALRGGFLASRSETSHTVSLRGNSWVMPGVHFDIGSRVGTTCRGYDDIIFVAQCEEVIPAWDHSNSDPLNIQIKIGQNKASMTTGERLARLVKKTRDIVNNIGVHMIS
jgi:hypothetical protein